MINLYAWDTPNGEKAVILLEELEVEYQLIPINILQGEQFEDWYLEISPSAKIPAATLSNNEDNETHRMFESGTILVYFAEKYQRFLSTEPRTKAEELSWVFWQTSGLGPMFGQYGHFTRKEDKIEYAINRYLNETKRLLQIIDKRLKDNKFLGGEEYSIADMMTWPWIKGAYLYLESVEEAELSSLSNLKGWYDEVNERPAVKSALAKLQKACENK
jgi:GST-like protein